jgi:hypothetical protein
VRDALNDAHLCLCLLFEVPQVEWHVLILLLDLRLRGKRLVSFVFFETSS